jgi:Rab proteins geranylgeranyltransferase component A
VYTTSAKSVLEKALSSLLATVSNGQDVSSPIYQLYYEQSGGTNSLSVDRDIATFSPTSLGLAFDDSILESVHEAWKLVNADLEGTSADYMKFEDREGGVDDDPFD